MTVGAFESVQETGRHCLTSCKNSGCERNLLNFKAVGKFFQVRQGPQPASEPEAGVKDPDDPQAGGTVTGRDSGLWTPE